MIRRLLSTAMTAAIIVAVGSAASAQTPTAPTAPRARVAAGAKSGASARPAGPARTAPKARPATRPTAGTPKGPAALPKPGNAPERADALHREAKAKFDAGKYAEAAKLFLDAFQLLKMPHLMGHVAKSHDKAGNKAEAIRYYQEYLKVLPKPSVHRAGAARRLAELRGQPVGPPRTSALPPPSRPPRLRLSPRPRPRDVATAGDGARPRPRADARRPPPREATDPSAGEDEESGPKPTRMRKAAWAMVGVTAILVTVTGVLALMTEDREDEVERIATFLDPTSTPPNLPLEYSGDAKSDYERLRKEGKRFEAATFAMLGITIGSAVAATTLFVLDHLKRRKDRLKHSSLRVQPYVGPRGGGMALGLEF